MARPLPSDADLAASADAAVARARARPHPDKAPRLTDRQLARLLRRVLAPRTSALERGAPGTIAPSGVEQSGSSPGS